MARPALDGLAMNLELLGRPPVLMVANLYSGTPADTTEFARLAAELNIPVLG